MLFPAVFADTKALKPLYLLAFSHLLWYNELIKTGEETTYE